MIIVLNSIVGRRWRRRTGFIVCRDMGIRHTPRSGTRLEFGLCVHAPKIVDVVVAGVVELVPNTPVEELAEVRRAVSIAIELLPCTLP